MPTSPSSPAAARATQAPDDSLALQLPDVLQFMQLLWAVVHGLEKTSKRMRGAIGVTGPQRLVLRVVGLFPGLSAGDLATILHIHPSTLTGVLQRLVTQGLLERVDDPRDRRRAILRLTPGGTRANAVRRGTVESALAKGLAETGKSDRDATRRVLERLARHLDVAAGEPVLRRVDASSADTAPARRTGRAVATREKRRTKGDG
jgi:MarR family transcriptional regulator, organic hydroperoxide resistance regulator